jgi:beta-phosphoglucomutase-like phosphatase (HAD superfamily)
MINPNDVNLIIFDLDGTIVMSQPLVYEATKRAFAKLGWPVTFEKEEINRFNLSHPPTATSPRTR